MNFDNDDDIMKAINAAGGGGNMDVEDELEALEREMNGGKKEKKKKKDGDDLSLSDLSDEEEEGKKKASAPKHEKHDSDDALAALENEGLDDVEEEEKPKPKQKEAPKPQPKKENPPPAQPQKKPTPQVNKQELEKAMKAKQSKITETTSSSEEDLYPEKAEKMYHNIEKMTSLTVLMEEKTLCDKIINYKKGINKDFEEWEDKKASIDDKNDIVTSYIQDGIWDFERYKKEIKGQYLWETKLLKFVEQDKKLTSEQKSVVMDRVNKRKKIIEEELKRNPDAEAAEEEAKEQQKPAATKPPANVDDKIDLYPEKAENKYHSVAKMDSVTVLEKEKELCDKIIEYKKKRGEDYDTWEFKKENLDTKNQTIANAVESGVMDLESYRKKIKNQYAWENKLLQFVEKDTNLNEAQKKVLRERVNNRKKFIEQELTQNPDEQAEGEEEAPKKEEPPKKEEKPKVEAKKKEELLPKKSLNPMFDVPKDKEEEEIKRLNQVVVDRLNEYRAAIDYFKNNELPEQQTMAIKSAKEICIELKKIQDGKWKEVNEFKLPDPVTPEYIYGCSKEERNNKFSVLIKDYVKQKKDIQKEGEDLIAMINRLNGKNRERAQEQIKPKLNELKTKMQTLDKLKNILMQKFQNVWVPAPIFVEVEEQKKIKKVNEEIPPNTLRIIFGQTTYKKNDRLYLKITNPETKKEETFEQKKAGDWTHTINWQTKDFRKVNGWEIPVEIWEKKTILKDKFKGRFTLKPSGIKGSNEFAKDFPINLDGKKETPVVSVTFKTRESCREPEYTTLSIKKLQATKIFPEFNLRGGNNNQNAIKLKVEGEANITSDDLKTTSHATVQKPVSKAPATKPAPAKKPQKQGAPQASAPKAGGAPAKKPGPPKAHIDKSEFNEEELKDPDCINCLNTLQVLDFKLNKYEDIRSKIDGRTPRELMQRIVKIKCKIQSLNDALGEDISPQDYLALLKTTFAHDKKLVDYFNQEKDAEKSKLVSERLPLLIKETEELMKQMPK